ncbi:MAG: O-methyltransferase [Lachnospiraceae bacterium]|nr:O-methyltransferase [Lachnospiraceae bacterium]
MIIDERLFTFINSFDKGNSEFLDELEKEAKRDYVPIIRKDMQNLLRFLLRLKRPVKILEVGTAVGFSALLMAENTAEECRITTIENYEKRIPIARENFKRDGMEHRITLLEGDATEILKELDETYDFIFMDAAKGQYLNFLPDLLRLLAEDGMLVSDNVLQDGDLMESRYAVTRRNRTIHSRMRDYLYELKNNPVLETVILPVGDGVTISIKTDNNVK